ncbi:MULTISPECIES: DeoR/GlpR family DNA-binding transcription regulator [Pseudonocardia]|uniref:Glucitol operon repressor n=2 Tax=Pseudonocardia TaxID=1847 RepID=A0A1Y2N4H9_PSEAH|nr:MULTISPECIES: DeoR/GlpR family DNA-binding transcription regulator [Pseudonocardia]OSY42039.1 Glucitol operon repressor [Pseudonocardia autotrophica]TDN75192.1 DeoR family transcriptional regulator [Pseudonocardia autotrophica]BBF99137.1 cytochrome c [Pseudonocardia autotrophica]GEC24057.1 cytochrome c [Pseudonocardia saturnea]
MIPDQRRERLLVELRGAGVLSVRELVELLGVSHMTVRRDIASLEAEGRVASVPGGVRLVDQLHSEPPYRAKASVRLDEKRAIAREAVGLIGNDQVVYLDAGTTLGQVAPLLWSHTGLTVVTNDLTTAVLLSEHPGLELYHVGGRVDRANRSTVGELTARAVRELNLDVALISTSSWDEQRGSTTPHEAKVPVKQAAMEVAARSYLVAGSDKYGQVGTFRVADLTGFDAVVTDSGLPAAVTARLRARGVVLRTAPPPGAPAYA